MSKTSLGRPLYYRINVQVITTRECPYKCPFCIERENPIQGTMDKAAQLESLKKVMAEHPNARLTVTGGEPGLYPEHVRNLLDVFRNNGNGVFASINTAGYNSELSNVCKDANINLSWNEYCQPNPDLFPGCTLQTVLSDKEMRLENICRFMEKWNGVNVFSFRYLSQMKEKQYDLTVFRELKDCPGVQIENFRVGDFFLYVNFLLHGRKARITLGDMYVQSQNNYQDGYSNIIIHPDGTIKTNWK